MRASALAIFFALLALAAPSAADDEALDLFNRGLAHMLAGRQDAGCPLIAQSYEREPLPGTLFTLAECEAQRGRIATAVRYYEGYLALFDALPPEKQARQRGREKIAATQKAALAPRVPTLTVTLPEDAPGGTVVRRDGEELRKESLGAPVPVDPGEHVVTARPPEGPVVEIRVTLGRGDERTLTLPVRPLRDPRRTGAHVALALGAAGLVAGAVTGGLALGEKGTIDANCAQLSSGLTGCTGAGKAAADRAQALAKGSTVAFGAGAGNLALAAVLYLVSRRPAAGAPPAAARSISSFAVVPVERAGAMIAIEGVW